MDLDGFSIRLIPHVREGRQSNDAEVLLGVVRRKMFE